MIDNWHFLYRTWRSVPTTQVGDPKGHYNVSTNTIQLDDSSVHFDDGTYDQTGEKQVQFQLELIKNNNDCFTLHLKMGQQLETI